MRFHCKLILLLDTRPLDYATAMRAPKKTKQASSEHDDSPGVTALVASTTHPLKPTVEAIRRTILAADSAITEGIKWNSPSFYCHGWFATIGSREPTQVDVVLHCGVSEVIDDSDRLLTWSSKDRALLSFKSDAAFQASCQAFQRIIQQWAAYQKSYHDDVA